MPIPHQFQDSSGLSCRFAPLRRTQPRGLCVAQRLPLLRERRLPSFRRHVSSPYRLWRHSRHSSVHIHLRPHAIAQHTFRRLHRARAQRCVLCQSLRDYVQLLLGNHSDRLAGLLVFKRREFAITRIAVRIQCVGSCPRSWRWHSVSIRFVMRHMTCTEQAHL